MASTVFVGLVEEVIGGCDCEFHFFRCEERCAGFAVFLEVDGTHEFLLVLHTALGPFLRAAATHEGEAGEEKENDVFH